MDYITKNHLSRRTVLRGLGVTMALPLLDAMIPAHTLLAKTAAVGKVRLSAIEMVTARPVPRCSAPASTCGHRPRWAPRST